jgi:hypothetical protein
MHRKPTHTDLYLHVKSEHHPAQKTAVLATLIWHARTICYAQNLGEEIEHLKKAFRQNGYSSYISCILYPKHKPFLQWVEPTGVAMLPCQRSVTNSNSRLLAKYNIKTIHIPARKNIYMLRSAKDRLGLKVLGIYCIHCKFGKVYIRQTVRNTETKFKEHETYISVTQRSLQWWNTASKWDTINFNISILGIVTGYTDRIMKGSVEI